MPTPIDTAKGYCEELVKAGVRATWDPRKIVTPCVLITPPEVTIDTNCGGEGEWVALAIAATTVGNSDAWTQLDDLVKRALQVLPVEVATPDSWSPDASPAMPVYRLTWSAHTEWS